MLKLTYPNTELDGLIFQIENIMSTFSEFLRRGARDHRTKATSIRASYIAYHIWLTRKVLVFDCRSCLAKVFLEQACIHAYKILTVTSTTMKT